MKNNNYKIVNSIGIELEYRWINFSDGTVNIEFLQTWEELYRNNEFTVTVPANCSNGFLAVNFELQLILDSLKQIYYSSGVNIIFKYLPHARADRRFEPYNSFPLNTFIGMIRSNSMVKQVYVEAPHNNKALPDTWVKVEVPIYNAIITQSPWSIDCMVYPDAGAQRRFSELLPDTLCVNPVVFDKTRDINTGKVVGMEYKTEPQYTADFKGTFFILDDICDGGRTFIECAKILKVCYPRCKVVLGVAHGIFANNLNVFEGLIDYIISYNIIGSYVTRADLDLYNALHTKPTL